MESILDLQVEVLTTYLNDGGKPPQRSLVNNAHAYLAAPYGIYRTKDGYLAVAMGSIQQLANLLDCATLLVFTEPEMGWSRRDEIKAVVAEHLLTRTTAEWLAVLEPADYWCSDVLTWDRLLGLDAFDHLAMVQEVTQSTGRSFRTTRCPIRIDGEIFLSHDGAPRLGENTKAIDEEFSLS